MLTKLAIAAISMLFVPAILLLAADANDFPETDDDFERETIADAYMIKKIDKIIVMQYSDMSKKKRNRS